MARKVFVSSAMSSDEELSEIAEHEPMAAMMWPWLITYFDDWGRAKASPREIKNSVFQANPLVTVELIKKALQLYHPKLIRLYEVEGKWFMCIPPEKWFKFQTHIRSGKRDNDGSKIPAPPYFTPDDDNSAHLREIARGIAEVSALDVNLQPSPSPSLSPSPSKTSSSRSSENPFGLFETHKFGVLDDITRDLIGDSIDDYSEDWVIRAVKEAVLQNVHTWSYVNKILKRWKETNHSEPWTLDKPEPPDNKVHQFNQRRGGYQQQQKPKLEPTSGKSNTPPLTPEELENIRIMARKLQDRGKTDESGSSARTAGQSGMGQAPA